MGSRRRVHLFAIQAQGVGLVEQGLEQLDGFWAAASVGQGLDEPERARQECAFGAGQAAASWRYRYSRGPPADNPSPTALIVSSTRGEPGSSMPSSGRIRRAASRSVEPL